MYPGPLDVTDIPAYRMLAFGAFVLCILSLVDGLFPQVQMFLLGGQILVTNSLVRLAFLTVPILGCFIHPKLERSELPMIMWVSCIAYLLVDTPHLILGNGLTLKEALTSYSDYYLLLLMGPALLAFNNAISEKVIVRGMTLVLLICALVGFAQYLTGQPLLRLESSDGRFEVYATSFFDEIRAFSFFSSGLSFGMFCSLSGALGIASIRTARLQGFVLLIISALACYSTLTRLCYLVFVCSCTSAVILTFGKKPRRGLGMPLLYFMMALITISAGAGSFGTGEASNLKDSGSLLMRIEQWTYYTDLIYRSSWIDKLFGVGTLLTKKNFIAIDNVPLALALHVGLVGLVLFSILMMKMWLYLRREALSTRQPVLIAAASLWSTLFCAGIFNIVFIPFGAVFAIAILCQKDRPDLSSTQLDSPAVLIETPLLQ